MLNIFKYIMMLYASYYKLLINKNIFNYIIKMNDVADKQSENLKIFCVKRNINLKTVPNLKLRTINLLFAVYWYYLTKEFSMFIIIKKCLQYNIPLSYINQWFSNHNFFFKQGYANNDLLKANDVYERALKLIPHK